MNLGYIGIGIMGLPMARNLLKAGHTLFVHNRTIEKCQPLVELGATACKSPAEVAERADVVFINVPDTHDIEAVLFGEKGVIESAREGLIVIDNSTISPISTRAFARKLKEKGADYLDAPVSGGDVGAQNRTLAIMVGGEESVYETCLPLFEVLGSKVVRVGALGAGQTCKAINQLFCAIHMVACCEGIELAKQAGLDPATMVDIVSSGAGGSWALANLGPKIIQGDLDPGFMIDLLVKDLKFTMELAHQSKLPLAGTSLAQHLFHEAQQQGHGRCGTQALCRVIENLMG